MSADLLAAFGAPEDLQGDDHQGTKQSTGQHSRAHTIISPASENNTWQPWPAQSVKQKIKSQQQDESLWQQDKTGADVLFDAEADGGEAGELEDDFGDFEDVENLEKVTAPAAESTQAAPKGVEVDLLGLEGFTTGQLSSLSLNQPSTDRPQLLEDNSSVHSHAGHDQGLSMTGNSVDDNGWDDFDDLQDPQAPSPAPVESTSQLPVDSFFDGSILESATTNTKIEQKSVEVEDDFEDWDEFDEMQAPINPAITTAVADKFVINDADSSSTREERPTNVPPPAIMLQTLPKVYSQLAKQASQSADNAIVGQLILDAFKVTARIIAGRTHRWKRDTILAQSMRIGAAGRSGGMKLTSLDKSETRREEQEIAEALAKWSQNSFVLNATLLKAKVSKPTATLSTNLTAKVVTGSDVMSANHVCPVCGLKRDERIAGIDMSVMDAFGEFWIEHWGHKDCHSIWYVCRRNDLLDRR